ncbi:unnamed protein product [Eruca vesicaria subsp. sativa]|uniref:Pentatricopeptide repeat-containing protein PNM1, mitochondrial n=1 Tax=Eruca vesicaria subsp. sativa TaxID=29727 RepID=A0ABC8M1N9_ERUVS|nr:unnamed protein product [Eruca vesicaria subsp. sativa]
MPPPLPSLQLRRLLLRTFTTSSPSSTPLHSHPRNTSFPLFPSRLFSSETNANPQQTPDPTQIALSFSKELTGTPESSDPHSISQRFHLSFSHITPTRDLILKTLNLSPEAGRAALGFNDWLHSTPTFSHDDESVSLFVDYFGRRRDFKGMLEIISKHKSVAGSKTLNSAIDRLARAGRAKQAVEFFENMENDYGFKRDISTLTLVVRKLCERGHASVAEKLVKNNVNEIFPDETICDLLISGWCNGGKLDEAVRFAGEMSRGGFEIGTLAYNLILDCVCKLCRKKDPFRLQLEVEKVLLEMETRGVPRNTGTFNVLINNLCKIRRTGEAMEVFGKMGEWGCQGDAETYLVLIRSLYQAGRIGEGDEMIDKMKSAGFGECLGKKEYYGFLKILCGIERLEHAMVVFKNMKSDGCKPGVKSYELLMGKMCANNQVTRANGLFKEAVRRGVEVSPKEYRVDPRFLKKKSKDVESDVKKRETLPEKTARKRRRLKQINMSFVKKPHNKMRRRM